MWTLIERLPAIGAAIPIRLVMYAVLFAALVVALWLARPGPRRWRFVLAGLAVISFLPTPSGAFWTSRVHEPRFFATPIYREYIRPGDRALVLPYVERDSWSMLWQAETGFRFSMIGGHIGQAIIPEECAWAGVWSSFAGGAPHGGPGRIRRFLISHGVNVIIEGLETGAWSKLLIKSALPDITPVSAAGVKVYWLPRGLSRDLPRGGPTVIPPLKLKNAIGRAVCGR